MLLYPLLRERAGKGWSLRCSGAIHMLPLVLVLPVASSCDSDGPGLAVLGGAVSGTCRPGRGRRPHWHASVRGVRRRLGSCFASSLKLLCFALPSSLFQVKPTHCLHPMTCHWQRCRRHHDDLPRTRSCSLRVAAGAAQVQVVGLNFLFHSGPVFGACQCPSSRHLLSTG